MQVINVGSINIDLVYRVPHLVQAGETLASSSFGTFAGGKGANQSVALARAGADIVHVGSVGEDGRWLVEKLADAGVDIRHVQTCAGRTGCAVIQVDDRGQNAIVLHAGANALLTPEQIQAAFTEADDGAVLLVQNETNMVAEAIHYAKEMKLRVCLNPAPFSVSVLDLPLDDVEVLVVNQTEGMSMAGSGRPDEAIRQLGERMPHATIVYTLGGDGVACWRKGRVTRAPAAPTQVVDTTGAGDAFIGYFLARFARDGDVDAAMRDACLASAVCVSRPGASDSIPMRDELDLA